MLSACIISASFACFAHDIRTITSCLDLKMSQIIETWRKESRLFELTSLQSSSTPSLCGATINLVLDTRV
ncbi:hypothetical protein Scep_023678 [Stephania cephalantha]|uniref:Uncharacterized protein n=1 Tax=Stephania cephalantha TaxID=152367 RepID=A0AAP0F0J7_9MAGN